MFRFFARRSGVLALSSIVLMVLSISVLQALYDVMDHKLVAILGVIALLAGFVSFFVFGAVFLYKSFVAANDATEAGGVRWLGYLVGATSVAALFWYMMVGTVVAGQGAAAKQLTPEQALTYVAEQMLSGMLLDVMEVYDLRLSDVTYAPNEYAFATMTLGMRLTGSFVLAAMLLKLFSAQRERQSSRLSNITRRTVRATAHRPVDLNEGFVRSLPDQGPVVMVNLVRFRARSLDGDGSGFEAYSRYSKADMPLLKKVGGTVLWAGRAEGVALGNLGQGRWDWIALAQYPSRAAFLAMMTSSEYAAANVQRENGVEDHVILAANQTYSKMAPG